VRKIYACNIGTNENVTKLLFCYIVEKFLVFLRFTITHNRLKQKKYLLIFLILWLW